MTAAELTLAIGKLSASERLSVQRFIDKLLEKRKTKYALPPISESEFLEQLDESEADIKAGRVYTWDQIKTATKERYGLCRQYSS